MTHTELIMLSICFGAVIGTFIANVATIIFDIVDTHKKKKSRRLDEDKRQSNQYFE